MVKIFDIKTYQPKSSDNFLFDTNVLVLLFNSLNPDPEDRRIESYSEFMFKILKVNAHIYLTSLNLSEFINVLINREYEIKKGYSPDPNNYRKKIDFRNSKDYIYAIEQIQPIIKNMLNSFIKINDNFEELLLDDMIDNLKIDFNDEYYNYFCNYNNLILVTDDADYKLLNSPLEIITANKKMLS